MVAKAHRRETSSRREVGQVGAPTMPYPRAGSHWRGERGGSACHKHQKKTRKLEEMYRTTILWYPPMQQLLL
eukprot:6914783-Prymnesium_polylepis.1